MSKPTLLGLFGVAPTLSDLDRRCRELERRAEQLTAARESFLGELSGDTPKTPAQRARWATLAESRQALELERECLELERRRVEELAAAVRAAPTHKWAAYAGLKAERHAKQAESLLALLRRKRRELADANHRVANVQGVACA